MIKIATVLLISCILISCTEINTESLPNIHQLAKSQYDELIQINKNLAESEQKYDIVQWSQQKRALTEFKIESNKKFNEIISKKPQIIPFEQKGSSDLFLVNNIQLVGLYVNDTTIMATYSTLITINKEFRINQNWDFYDSDNKLLSKECFEQDSLTKNILYANASNINTILHTAKIVIP